jgi:hypothetical protein
VAVLTERDRRQLETYLELSGCPLGLLFNFGAPVLVNSMKRVVNHFPEGTEGHARHR